MCVCAAWGLVATVGLTDYRRMCRKLFGFCAHLFSVVTLVVQRVAAKPLCRCSENQVFSISSLNTFTPGDGSCDDLFAYDRQLVCPGGSSLTLAPHLSEHRRGRRRILRRAWLWGQHQGCGDQAGSDGDDRLRPHLLHRRSRVLGNLPGELRSGRSHNDVLRRPQPQSGQSVCEDGEGELVLCFQNKSRCFEATNKWHKMYNIELNISLVFTFSVHRGVGEGDARRSEAAGPCHRSRSLSHPQAQKPN